MVCFSEKIGRAIYGAKFTIWRRYCTCLGMLRPTQIIAIFGVFLSMFYIFKYGGTNPDYAKTMCQELMALQMRVVSDVSPSMRADKSDDSFDVKLKRALKTLEANTEFSDRQSRLIKIEKQLEGQACPAPNFVQMTRFAVGSI